MIRFDTRKKVLSEFERYIGASSTPAVIKDNGVPRDMFVRHLAAQTYKSLDLDTFNQEYVKYEPFLDELIKKGAVKQTVDFRLYTKKMKVPELLDESVVLQSAVNDTPKESKGAGVKSLPATMPQKQDGGGLANQNQKEADHDMSRDKIRSPITKGGSSRTVVVPKRGGGLALAVALSLMIFILGSGVGYLLHLIG